MLRKRLVLVAPCSLGGVLLLHLCVVCVCVRVVCVCVCVWCVCVCVCVHVVCVCACGVYGVCVCM